MTDPSPALAISTLDDGVACAGEIDAHTAPDLERALSAVVADGTTVRLDMSDITFIDSSGIRSLISSATTSRELGGDIVIVPSPMVTRVLEMSGLTSFFTLADAD